MLTAPTVAPILSVADVAALLQCSDETVREQAVAGTLPGVKFGRDWVFPAPALLDAIDQQARDEAENRRRPAPSGATLTSVPRGAPPALPTVGPPGPRRAGRRSAAPSLVKPSP
jgi:excisionase family DNA binding protein